MNTGWVKLHRKALENGVLQDPIAWTLFSYLMLTVDRKTGKTKITRAIIAKELACSDNTIYSALKRLEKKYEMTTTVSTTKNTEITLLHWSKYQGGKAPVNSFDNNGTTTGQQRDNNAYIYTRSKEVENKRILLRNTEFGNSEINESSKYFLERMKIPKEDCSTRQSRQYWHLLLKESKRGLEGVKWLIDVAAKDKFFCNNITSSKDLWYKRVKLISRSRGTVPRIAIMGTEKKGSLIERRLDYEKTLENNHRYGTLLSDRGREDVLPHRPEQRGGIYSAG